jgi:hypothetical protein
MTDEEERRIISLFVSAQDLIPLEPDGFPAQNGFEAAMMGSLGILLLKAGTVLANRGELTRDEVKLNILTAATRDWIAAFERGDRLPDIAEARFAARAEYMEPQW